ncbi:hypothetical protein THRCLA_03995 [Thraustotheca clavata]|uniref:PRA1 family protein n=1 Tax=Thraustotheca clavata TaxID=74557 RepID=A0A1W0A0E9_9STRA|nr:hypothetical protein THRCLA_03995 [Thraustotheca clavata]
MERPVATDSLDAEEVKLHSFLDQIVSNLNQKINIHAIRSLFSFMGIGEMHPFTLLPKLLIKQRVERNLDFYFVNYLLLFGLVLFCVLIFHPFAMLCCMVLVVSWITVLVQRKQIQVLLGPNVKIMYAIYALVAGTVLVFVFLLLQSFLLATSITGVLGLAHAILRNTPASDKVDVILENNA